MRATSVGIFDTLAHISIHAGGLGNCGIDAGKSKTVHIYVYIHMFFLFRDIRGGVSEDLKIFQYPTKSYF